MPKAGPSCCAAFELGSTGSTACPASYGKLVTAAACEAAAGAVGTKYGGSGAYSSYPYGCYWHAITGRVYYNSNAAGVGNAFAQALCSGAARTSAPAFAQSLARTLLIRACVRVRACVPSAHTPSSYACVHACARLRSFSSVALVRLLVCAWFGLGSGSLGWVGLGCLPFAAPCARFAVGFVRLFVW